MMQGRARELCLPAARAGRSMLGAILSFAWVGWWSTPAAEQVNADAVVRQPIVEVGSYPVGPIDAEMKSKVRRDLRGIEAQAVAFSLSSRTSSDDPDHDLVARGRLRTLAALDEQAFEQFRSAFLKAPPLGVSFACGSGAGSA